MKYTVQQVTKGPKHHLFGFHDLIQTNKGETMALCLEIDDISRPPLPGERCRAGFVDLKTNVFTELHTTNCWNYPQGSRQQWLGDSDICLCNDRLDDGTYFCHMFDASKGKEISTLPFAVHGLNVVKRSVVSVNYDRLFAVAGYGYTPLKGRNIKIVDIPDDDGLWVGSLDTGKNCLIASMMQVASCGEAKAVKTGFPHYVTHPLMNPSGTRVAFLHRYRLSDGGETTRLLSIGIDGSGLRCLAKGFLSHFTWIDNENIFIWGEHLPKVFALREAQYLRMPMVRQFVKIAKNVIKSVRMKRRPFGVPGVVQSKAFLMVRDSEDVDRERIALGVITEDGHPMANPKNPHLIICDTYPDAFGDRQLYLYDLNHSVREDIASFRRIFKKPDMEDSLIREVQAGTDPRILERFDVDRYIFSRSGLHCDLHPRWSHDGSTVYFDSIHDGSRQVYCVRVRE